MTYYNQFKGKGVVPLTPEEIKDLLKLLEKALASEIVDKLVITIKPK